MRLRAPARVGLFVLAVCLFFGTGCIYSKRITNAHVRDLDTGRIVVGETTVLDVLDSWGPPAPTEPMGLLRPTDARTFVPSARIYRYVSREMRCASFLAAAPIIGAPVPVAPLLPFVWCDDQPAYVLVLEFDGQGVVKRVSKGTTQVVWRPWNGGGDRAVEIQTTARRGRSLR